jgi:hypothetical protein
VFSHARDLRQIRAFRSNLLMGHRALRPVAMRHLGRDLFSDSLRTSRRKRHGHAQTRSCPCACCRVASAPVDQSEHWGVVMEYRASARIALVVWVCALALSGNAAAVVTTIATYKLGEADAGAVSGAVAANPTTPTVGASALARLGSPTYSTLPAPASRPSPLSIAFNGSSDGFRGSVLSTAIDNFGIEAWVRPTSNSGNAVIAYNGNTSAAGWGLFRSGASYAFLFGGNVLAGGTNSVELGRWTHLALVRASGTTTLYKDGVAIASTPIGPNPPSGGFSVGINPILAAEHFAGNIDEVRVFTFAAGQFSTADLSTSLSYTDPPQVVPVNSWQALFGLFLLLMSAGALSARRFSRIQ